VMPFRSLLNGRAFVVCWHYECNRLFSSLDLVTWFRHLTSRPWSRALRSQDNLIVGDFDALLHSWHCCVPHLRRWSMSYFYCCGVTRTPSMVGNQRGQRRYGWDLFPLSVLWLVVFLHVACRDCL